MRKHMERSLACALWLIAMEVLVLAAAGPVEGAEECIASLRRGAADKLYSAHRVGATVSWTEVLDVLHNVCDAASEECHRAANEYVYMIQQNTLGDENEEDYTTAEMELRSMLGGVSGGEEGEGGSRSAAEEMCLRLGLATTSCCATEYSPEQLHLSVGVSAHEMTVSWLTAAEMKEPQVQFGRSVELERTESANYTVSFTSGGWGGFIYHTFLDQLEPNTLYYYRVGDALLEEWSEVVSFQTPKVSLDDEEEISICMYGDQGVKTAAYEVAEAIKEAAQTGRFSLVMLAGDFSYADGVSAVWDEWGRMVEPYAQSIPVMGISGNHEVYNNFVNYRLRFGFPGFVDPEPNPVFGFGGSPMYYSFNYGHVHFTLITLEEEFESDLEVGGPQRSWLEEDLLAANENRDEVPWLVVVVHRPLYCTYDSSRCTSKAEKYRELLEDLFLEHRVDFVLTGHNHMYERTFPVYDSKPVEPTIETNATSSAGHAAQMRVDPVLQVFVDPPYPTYVVVGTAGRRETSSFVTPPPEWSAKQVVGYGYSILSTSRKRLHFEYYNTDHELLDEMIIVRSHGSDNDDGDNGNGGSGISVVPG